MAVSWSAGLRKVSMPERWSSTCEPVMQISVTHGLENMRTATLKIVGAPHMAPHMVSIGA
jgi:hypothetical protein